MRWIAPIGTQGRRTTARLELGGVELPADAPVAAVISSANRDERRFADPDRFDLHREPRRLATFGFGRHFCSGHAFARAQERIALRALLERYPRLELAAEPRVLGLGVPGAARAPRPARAEYGEGGGVGTRTERGAGYSALADREAVLAALIAADRRRLGIVRASAPGGARARAPTCSSASSSGCPRSPTTRPRCSPTPRGCSTSRTRRRGRSTSATSARPASRSGCSPRRSPPPTTSTSRSPRAPPTCVEAQAVEWVAEFVGYPVRRGRVHERRHDLEPDRA